MPCSNIISCWCQVGQKIEYYANFLNIKLNYFYIWRVITCEGGFVGSHIIIAILIGCQIETKSQAVGSFKAKGDVKSL